MSRRRLLQLNSGALAALLLMLGSAGLVLPLSHAFREVFFTLLVTHKLFVVTLGTLCLALGGGLMARLLLSLNHSTYVIRKGTRSIRVDSAVVDRSVQTCLQQLLPNRLFDSKVKLSRSGLRISVELSVDSSQDIKGLTEHIEKGLRDLMVRVLGEQSALRLDVHFRGPVPKTQHASCA